MASAFVCSQKKHLLPVLRLLVAWGTVLFFAVTSANHSSPLIELFLFLWLFAVILWCAFGVVREADQLAHLFGEPYGTLILTLSIVLIEVILIAAVMAGGETAATIARDSMISVMMIIMNGVIGLCLIIRGISGGQHPFNRSGSAVYLGILVPLTLLALVAPAFLSETGDGSLSAIQAIIFSATTVIIYGTFLILQTGRLSYLFMAPGSENHTAVGQKQGQNRLAIRGTTMIILLMVPIVLLAEHLAVFLDQGLKDVGAPAAAGGFIIAMIVFAPETITSLKAARNDELQRVINLCHGAFVSTLGLTVPAVLTIGLLTGQTVILAAPLADAIMIIATLALSAATFLVPRTGILAGILHFLLFAGYIAVIFTT
jgi:Ca2+/H+ antiporter